MWYNGLVVETRVSELPLVLAAGFIEHWHYSGCVPTGKNIFFGWFVPGDQTLLGESLYAVADYGIGVNPYQAQYLARCTGYEVAEGNLVELKRLCRSEPRLDRFPLTAFLARCHRLLRASGYRYVVSYSDPFHGHSGGIYKAANFQHLGATNAEWHVQDADGVIRHRRYAYRYARRNGVSTAEARQALGLKRVQMPPKDRWFLRIG